MMGEVPCIGINTPPKGRARFAPDPTEPGAPGYEPPPTRDPATPSVDTDRLFV